MLSTREAYDEAILKKHEGRFRARAEARLRAQRVRRHAKCQSRSIVHVARFHA
jgi:hypothetical protein